MKIKATVYSHNDPYEGITAQEVEINNKEEFNCYNLDECPEDAIIGRDLFDANDYLNAVEFGIKLAKQGYDGIEIEEKESNE